MSNLINSKKMKQSITIALLFFTVSAFVFSSCNRCEKGSGNIIHSSRSVPAFTGVKLKGSFNLYLRQDSIQKVEVVADDNIAPSIECYVEGGTLVLKQKHNRCIRKCTRRDIYISAPSLNSVVLDGSGNIRGENVFTGNNMSVVIDGSGNVNLAFEGSSLNAVISGSGDMNLSGSAGSVFYSVSGSGNINASGLKSRNAEARVSGSGNIDLAVSETLTANISGSGDITYQGAPSVSTHVSGSGSVNRKY